jgi:lysozyme family protein
VSDFQKSLAVVLDHEGAEYTNETNDLGGPTKYGIALNEDDLSPWLGRPATVDDIKNMTAQFAGEIYKAHYWSPLNLDGVNDDNVATAIFDQGVLCGIGHIAKVVQGLVGVDQDGEIGPISLAAINAPVPETLIEAIVKKQLAYFQSRVDNNSNLSEFLKGWTNRVDSLLTLG